METIETFTFFCYEQPCLKHVIKLKENDIAVFKYLENVITENAHELKNVDLISEAVFIV